MSIIAEIARPKSDYPRPYSPAHVVPHLEDGEVMLAPAPLKTVRPSTTVRRAIAGRLGDDWLEVLLHRAFDAVQAEPIPSDLVKLLEELDRQQTAVTAG